ncbi:hypothetical protein DV738_g759, partial [Chaetothyriales sp. CBS 135597]
MLGDLVELATSTVHPDHEPDLSPGTRSRSRSSGGTTGQQMPPRRLALSLALELALNTAVAWQTQSKTELAAISQPDPSGSQIAWLLAEKLALLAVFWFGGFDAYDVASLTLLSATPVSILLALFYNIHPATLASETAISIAAHTAPYLFLRPVSAAHRQHPSSSAAATPQTRNHAILTDPWTTITTSLLASAILATSLELSLLSFLPTFLITRFSSLRTLEFAHESPVYVVLPTLLIALIPAGYAAVEFLFTVAFTIGQLQGVEWEGALGYAGLWVGSLSLVGVALDWVGGPAE